MINDALKGFLYHLPLRGWINEVVALDGFTLFFLVQIIFYNNFNKFLAIV